MNINYFQFFDMVPEAILVVVLVITFIADFIAHGKENKSWFNPLVSVMLLASAVATLFVGDDRLFFSAVHTLQLQPTP